MTFPSATSCLVLISQTQHANFMQNTLYTLYHVSARVNQIKYMCNQQPGKSESESNNSCIRVSHMQTYPPAAAAAVRPVIRMIYFLYIDSFLVQSEPVSDKKQLV